MKKQTAVEWFVEKLKAGIDPEDGSISMNWLHDGTIEQAKELEKEQELKEWIETWSLGYDSGFNNCMKNFNNKQ